MKPRIRTLQSTLRVADLRHVAVPADLQAGRTHDARRIYHSGRWVNRVRPDKLKRDPRCQMCAARGLVSIAVHVDHWTPLAQGGDPWADDNLVSLCTKCHSRKTRCEQLGRPFPDIAPSAPRSFTIA